MTKDRLEELITGRTNAIIGKSTSQQADESEGAEKKKLTVKKKNRDSSNLEEVYQQVSNINGQITRMQEDIVQLRQHQVQMQESTRTETNLEKVKKGDEEMVIYRVAKTQHSLITKMFRDTMEDYESTLATHQAILEDVIKKQLKITDREELCTILQAEDTLVDNYRKELLRRWQSLEYTGDIYKQLLVTEKIIEIIRDMIFSIAMHVMQQGELIERIEDHIGNGLALTQQGQRKLNKAEKFRQRAKKKKRCMLI